MTAEPTLASLYSQAMKLREAGRFAEALPLARQALDLAEQGAGPDHPAVATLLNDVAALYSDLGRPVEAEPLFKRALAIREKALDENHPHIALSLNNLAALYKTQGRYTDAEPLLKRALAVADASIDPDHPDITGPLGNLAGVYQDLGRYADAEPLLKRALTVVETALGVEHPLTATQLNNLAELYRLQDRFSEAEPLHERALAIREKALGKNHPSTATTLNNLGLLYHAQGRLDEAEQLFQRALVTKDKVFSEDHLSTANTLDNIASLFDDQGRYSEAEPHRKRAIAISEKALGADHPLTAISLLSLAEAYRAQRRFAEAERLLKRALTIFETKLGGDNPHVLITLFSLGLLCIADGRAAEAKRYAARADRIPGWQSARIPILFATNRQPRSVDGTTTLTNEAIAEGSSLSLGVAAVLAPESEVTNRAGRRANALGLLQKAEGRLTSEILLKLDETVLSPEPAQLVGIARDRLSRASQFRDQALIFVHGFNTTFDQAMLRAAKVSYDLDFDGLMLAFSWPSVGSLWRYREDRRRASKAASALADAIEATARLLPEVRLNILAHSMGCEVTLQALELVAKRNPTSATLRLGELILAHADVAPSDYKRIVTCIRKLGLGVTSYSNAKDRAMAASWWQNWRMPIGGRPAPVDGADSIDLTRLGQGALDLNHSVLVTAPLPFSDMHRLLLTGQRPVHERTPAFKEVRMSKGIHWAYMPKR